MGHKQGVEEPGRGGMELGGPSFLSVSRGLRSSNPGVTSCRREGREVRDRKQTVSVAATCRERRASDSRFPPPSCILQPVTAKTRTTRSRKSKGRRANVGRRLNRCGTRWLMRTASSANDADPFVHGGPPGQPHGDPGWCTFVRNHTKPVVEFPHRGHRDVQVPLRLCGHRAWDTQAPPHQCHGPPDCGVDTTSAQRNHIVGLSVQVVVYFLAGNADPGFREAGRVAAATLLEALAVAGGLLNATAMTS